MDKEKELAQAVVDLDEYEAGLLRSIGLGPRDGPIDHYLTEASFMIESELTDMRIRVSELMSQVNPERAGFILRKCRNT